MSEEPPSNSVESRLMAVAGKQVFRKAKKLVPLACAVDGAGKITALFRGDNGDSYHRVETVFFSDPKLAKTAGMDELQVAAALQYLKFGGKPAKPAGDGQAPYQGLRRRELDELVGDLPKAPRGKVILKASYNFPHAPSKWERFQIEVELRVGERDYAGNLANIRQLHFNKGVTASFKLDDFPLQSMQIIRFLAVNAEGDGRKLSLDAERTADFFHCLIGYPWFYLNRERINIRPESVEPALFCEFQGPRASMRPGLLLDKGAVPLKNVKVIAGTHGCWVGVGGEYWWIPAVVDVLWLRNFLRSSESVCGRQQAEELVAQSGNQAVKIIVVDKRSKPAEDLKCRVVIDMGDRAGVPLPLRLTFVYGEDSFPPDGLRLVAPGGRIVRRDAYIENLALDELLRFGFRRIGESSEFVLDDEEAAGMFLDAALPVALKRLRGSALGGKLAIASHGGAGLPVPRLACELRGEYEGGYEIACRVFIPGGVHIPWETMRGIVAAGRRYFRLADGRFAAIDEELAAFVAAVGEVAQASSAADSDIIRLPKSQLPFWLQAAETIPGAVPGDFAQIAHCLGKHPAKAGERQRPSLESMDSSAMAAPPARFEGELRDYQRQAVRWLSAMADMGYNPILADEMGLGKTVQALALLGGCRSAEPSLVVCPTSLVNNWEREARRFLPSFRVLLAAGANRSQVWESCGDADLVITSYALARRDLNLFAGRKFNFLVLDEAQHIKNPNTANAQSCKAIQAEHRLVLSGTPIENNVGDLWSIFDFLHPGMLGPLKQFKSRFNGDIPSALRGELSTRVAPFIARRRKSEVLSELPPKVEQVVWCQMGAEQRALYDTLREDGRRKLESILAGGGRVGFEMLAALTRMRQACCHPALLPAKYAVPANTASAKTELFQEIILEAIDSGHKILFFSQFTSMLKIARAWLEENTIPYEYLDGSTTDRMERVDHFNSDDSLPIFLLSLKAGGTGLNLTAADTVIIHDPWWNPAVESQAIDRTHRIGQKRSVQSFKLVVGDSIEERIIALQQSKRQLFQDLVDSPQSVANLDADDIRFLLD